MKYALNDIYICIQGEGVKSGTPMVLVRLQGCGVGCPWCDTKETWLRPAADRGERIDAILGTNPRWGVFEDDVIAEAAWDACGLDPIPWALLTGGEPAEQHLHGLVAALHARGFRVAVESSGTARGFLDAGADWICVSPKVGMPGGREVIRAAFREADEIKMVVGKASDVANLDDLLARFGTKSDAIISLQPVSESPGATQLCVQMAMRRGWNVSIQIHKIMGVR